ncbi:hypothetical protein LIH_08665 [Leptospira interrogans serovar Hardjo-prajitno]|nr:hypothetical protein LIH_08665 [Leptospira interrogans serovar Hardjo-prajitno]
MPKDSLHYNFCMSSHIFVKRKRLASIGARRIQDRFLDLIDSILLSWKNSITRKALQKNEKNADSKKGKQNVCFSKSQSNNFLKCSIN